MLATYTSAYDLREREAHVLFSLLLGVTFALFDELRFEEFYGEQLRSLGYEAIYRRRAAHKKDGTYRYVAVLVIDILFHVRIC